MKTATLEKIQKLSNLGRIFSKIGFVFCMVGMIGSLIGIACINMIPMSFKIGDVTIHSLVEVSSNISTGSALTAMLIAVILCAADGALCKMYETYFKHELAAGTPFTFEGAKEVLHLGIATMVLPFVGIIVGDIAYKIMNMIYVDVKDMHIDGFTSFGLGIALIIVSLVLKYGAEIAEGKVE